MLLELLKEALPDANTLLKLFNKAKNIICDLGLDYVRIHACKNDYFGRSMNIEKSVQNVKSLDISLLMANGRRLLKNSYLTS